jgi:hypothetical protein
MAPGLLVQVVGQHMTTQDHLLLIRGVDDGAGEEAAELFLDKRAMQGSTFTPPTTAGAPTNSGARNST